MHNMIEFMPRIVSSVKVGDVLLVKGTIGEFTTQVIGIRKFDECPEWKGVELTCVSNHSSDCPVHMTFQYPYGTAVKIMEA